MDGSTSFVLLIYLAKVEKVKQEYSEERRSFLRQSFGIMGFGFVSFAFLNQSCEQDEDPIVSSGSVDINLNEGKYTTLLAVGGTVKQLFERKNNLFPLIITRTEEDTFSVISSRCTHQDYEIDLPVDKDGVLVTTCQKHGAQYLADGGKVIEQPKPSGTATDLDTFEYEFNAESNVLTIHF